MCTGMGRHSRLVEVFSFRYRHKKQIYGFCQKKREHLLSLCNFEIRWLMRSKGAILSHTSAKLRRKLVIQVKHWQPALWLRLASYVIVIIWTSAILTFVVGNYQYDYYDYYSDNDYMAAFSSFGGCYYRSFHWWLGGQQVGGWGHSQIMPVGQ